MSEIARVMVMSRLLLLFRSFFFFGEKTFYTYKAIDSRENLKACSFIFRHFFGDSQIFGVHRLYVPNSPKKMAKNKKAGAKKTADWPTIRA